MEVSTRIACSVRMLLSPSPEPQPKLSPRSPHLELVCTFTVVLLPVILYISVGGLYFGSIGIRSNSEIDSAVDHSKSASFRGEQSKEESDPFSPHCQAPLRFLTEFTLLDCAARAALLHEKPTHKKKKKRKNDDDIHGSQAPRVAFLFISRGPILHEPLWRRFFDSHESRYSVYVHARPDFRFPSDSLFHRREIPSEPVERLSVSLVDAMRRLLAHAVLDPLHGPNNAWFVFACEATIPIRSFAFTYDYLTKSKHSFVESFAPVRRYLSWDTLPEFPQRLLRKGELWMALQRRHTRMVLADWTLYYKFRSHCHHFCGPDEQYIQTLLGFLDPQGIANRTVMYVDWSHEHASSPQTFDIQHISPQWFRELQSRNIDKDGQYLDTSAEFEEHNSTPAWRICDYNGVAYSPCFLFARKVAKDASPYIQSLSSRVLGY